VSSRERKEKLGKADEEGEKPFDRKGKLEKPDRQEKSIVKTEKKERSVKRRARILSEL